MTIRFPSQRPTAARTVLVAALCVAGLFSRPGDAEAQRKGFVLNFGLGPAQTRLSASEGNLTASVTKGGLGTDLKIGYAPSNKLLIYYSNDAAFIGSDDTGAVLSASGISGVGATYFFRDGTPSFYAQGSIGLAAFHELYDDGEMDSMTGTGLNLGGGFEFARHWHLDLDLVFSSVEDDFGTKFSIRTVRIGINWLLY